MSEVAIIVIDLAKRVSYETVWRWVIKFGPLITRNVRRRQGRPFDVWCLDEVAFRISGRNYWLGAQLISMVLCWTKSSNRNGTNGL